MNPLNENLAVTNMGEKNKYEIYVQHMVEIRRLSTPSLEGISEAGDYSKRLRENFTRIGELAMENRQLLENDLFPRLGKGRQLSQEEFQELSDFSAALVDAELAENLDLPIANLLSEHLLDAAKGKGSMELLIHQMDMELDSCYALMNMASRVSAYPQLDRIYRERGLEIGGLFRALTEPDDFAAIKDEECRELVLTDARYSAAFYENYCGNPQANKDNLDLLEYILQIADDPFYRTLVPDFDWSYFRYRALQYFMLMTNYCNIRGFDEEQIAVINSRSEELFELYNTDPELYGQWDSFGHLRMSYELNRFLAGKISREQYKEVLLDIYQNRDKQLYDEGGIAENVEVPTELLCLFRTGALSEDDQSVIQMLYREVLDYVFRMPNSGTFSFMLELLSIFTERFIEIPGGMTFENMMLSLLAALHPPTYVHSQMVAGITKCLCEHLLKLRPDLFTGVCGCRSSEEIQEKQEEILDFAYHSALCHDTGKIFIMDTVFVYGRNLLDVEFDVLKTHPKMGAAMLSQFPSTSQYADLAIGHHKWYDNTRGYPDEFDPRTSKDRTILGLLQCADCMDAATDTIGRSYKKGKTLPEFIEEIKAGAGTQYAPWLGELLEDKDTFNDIQWLLSTGREKLYRETYLLLKNMHEQAE